MLVVLLRPIEHLISDTSVSFQTIDIFERRDTLVDDDFWIVVADFDFVIVNMIVDIDVLMTDFVFQLVAVADHSQQQGNYYYYRTNLIVNVVLVVLRVVVVVFVDYSKNLLRILYQFVVVLLLLLHLVHHFHHPPW